MTYGGLLAQIAWLLVILAIWLFGPGVLIWLMERVFDVAAAGLPGPKNRRERKRLKNIPGAVSFSTQKKIFWWFVGSLSAFALIDLFVVPNSLRLEIDWLIPCALSAFEAALLIIFVGPMHFFGRHNWVKWTYWTSVITTVSVLLWICRAFHFVRPGGIFGLLFLSLLQFVWLFGILGRIDRNEAELHQLNSSQGTHQ